MSLQESGLANFALTIRKVDMSLRQQALHFQWLHPVRSRNRYRLLKVRVCRSQLAGTRFELNQPSYPQNECLIPASSILLGDPNRFRCNLKGVIKSIRQKIRFGANREGETVTGHQPSGLCYCKDFRDHSNSALNLSNANQRASEWPRDARRPLLHLVVTGRPAEGMSILRRIYDWFTEGFAYADLRRVKATLDAIH